MHTFSPEPVAAVSSESRNAVRNTRILVLLVIATNVLGNVSLSHGMQQVGRIISASPLDYLKAFANPWTLLGICVLIGALSASRANSGDASLGIVLGVAMLVTSGLLRWQSRD